MIETNDDGTGAANRVSPEHDWPGSTHVGNTVVVDDAEQFGFFDAIDGLGLLVMIDQHYPFRVGSQQVGTREIAEQFALGIDDRQGAAASQSTLDFAHLIFGMAVI